VRRRSEEPIRLTKGGGAGTGRWDTGLEEA
jgi:hypothetical protein